VPLNHTASGTLVALVMMLSLADRVAAAVGLKRTEIVHDAPAPSLDGQLLPCANDDA
jgi:hypothetical protein